MKRSFLIVFTISLLMIILSACGGETSTPSVDVPVESEPAAEVITEVEVEDNMPEEEEPAPTEAVSEEMEAEDEMVEAEAETIIEETESVEVEAAVEAVEEEAEEEVAVVEEVAAPAVVDPTDFAMISNTGRAQFLNSYASW